MTDPQTGLPIKLADKDLPKWIELGNITTTSKRAGINISNAAGLCLMAIAPILAIVITSLRVRRKEPSPICSTDSDQVVQGTIGGYAGILIGLTAVGLLGTAFVRMLNVSADIRADAAVDQPAIMHYLVAAGVAGVLVLIVAGIGVIRLERRGGRASMALRLASGLATLNVGICGGLILALTMIAQSFASKTIEYDNELSGISCLILFVMLGIIVVGLCWCFYRAIKAQSSIESRP